MNRALFLCVTAAVLVARALAGSTAPPPVAKPPAPVAAVPPGAPHTELSFCRAPFVSPLIIQDLLAWVSDGGDQVVAVNLTESDGSNRYSGEVRMSPARPGSRAPQVTTTVIRDQGGERAEETISYEWVGVTSSGVHVLHTWEAGGGTMVAHALLLMAVEQDQGLALETSSEEGGIGNRDAELRFSRPRLLLRKLGEFPLGDRWAGELRVDGNKIHVGRDQGFFGAGVDGASSSPYNRRDVVLSLADGMIRPPVLQPCP